MPFQSIKDKIPNRPIWSTTGSYMRKSMLKQLRRVIGDYDIDEQEFEGRFPGGCMRSLLRRWWRLLQRRRRVWKRWPTIGRKRGRRWRRGTTDRRDRGGRLAGSTATLHKEATLGVHKYQIQEQVVAQGRIKSV